MDRRDRLTLIELATLDGAHAAALADLSPNVGGERVFVCVLAALLRDDTGLDTDQIARDVRESRAVVQHALQHLDRAGLVEWSERTDPITWHASSRARADIEPGDIDRAAKRAVDLVVGPAPKEAA